MGSIVWVIVFSNVFIRNHFIVSCVIDAVCTLGGILQFQVCHGVQGCRGFQGCRGLQGCRGFKSVAVFRAVAVFKAVAVSVLSRFLGRNRDKLCDIWGSGESIAIPGQE